VLSPRSSELDLSDVAALRKYIRSHKPRAIVNAAAYTAVDAAEGDRERAYAINAVAPLVLAEEASRLSIPLIHFSTDYVFSGEKASPYIETDEPSPINVYGETKLEGERGVASACDHSMTFRCSWVYSLRGRNFLLTILRLARERDSIQVVNDQHGCPTWARLIAGAASTVLGRSLGAGSDGVEYFRSHSGIFHLTGPNTTTWFEFAQEIVSRAPQSSCTVQPIPTSSYPTPARRPRNSALDSTRARTVLGLSLPSWETQLALCLEQ
jgi:dTDP-4-dehydrorhamnose reductase